MSKFACSVRCGIVLGLSVLCPLGVHAQIRSLDNDIITSPRPLTAAQTAQVADYVGRWVPQMVAGDDADTAGSVSDARASLVNPASSSLASSSFLLAYTNVLQGELKPLLDGENPQDRINAIIILCKLGTDGAVDTLLSYCESDDAMTRRWVANGIAATMRNVVATGRPISRSILDQAAREMALAATAEEDSGVFRRQLQAQVAIHDAAVRLKLSVATTRQRLFGVIKSRLEKLAEIADRSEDMATIFEAMNGLRRNYLALDSASKRQIGPHLAVLCERVFRVAVKQWDSAHADPESKASYSEAIGFAEAFAKHLYGALPSGAAPLPMPQTTLRESWDLDDRQRFGEDAQKWQLLIRSVPVYRDADDAG